MLPWTLLATAPIPGGEKELRLHRRGSELSIRVDGDELMNSRVHGSEDALASVAGKAVWQRPGARVLLGGLGMGFTLAALLRGLQPDGRVLVSELVPEVVEWHRGPLAEISRGILDDRRVDVRILDVATIIQQSKTSYDAIQLDVDNGPAGLTSKRNDRLYTLSGLRASFMALRPGGVLAVWSAGPDPSFTRRLSELGFEIEEVRVRGRGAAGGARFLIWVARRPVRGTAR